MFGYSEIFPTFNPMKVGGSSQRKQFGGRGVEGVKRMKSIFCSLIIVLKHKSETAFLELRIQSKQIKMNSKIIYHRRCTDTFKMWIITTVLVVDNLL